MSGRGSAMTAEMAEQPEVLARLVDRAAAIRSIAATAMPRHYRSCALVARGSSGHAGVLGRYLVEVATGRPVSVLAPSVHTLYRAPVDYRGVLLIAVSQSGATPEVVEVARALRVAGASVLAVTNDASSPLAAAADQVIALGAGAETAVPATKTVTATLLTMLLITEGLGGRPLVAESDLHRLPGAVEWAIRQELVKEEVVSTVLAGPYLVALGRGYLLAAARECALKLREATGLPAEGWSPADLRHGPVAAVRPGLPVLSLRTSGPAGQDTMRLEADLEARGAKVIRATDEPCAEIRLPPNLPEPLVVIPAVVRGQQLAYAGSMRLGLDPDHPLGLAKVTAT